METVNLVLFSGGMDSTYVAWKLLSIGAPNIHLHHVTLKNDTERMWVMQYKAVKDILNYLKDRFDGFGYSQSAYEFYQFPAIGMDSDVLLLSAQKVAQNCIGYKVKISTGWKAPYEQMGEIQRRLVDDRIKRDVSGQLWTALISGASNNRENIDERIYYPLMDDGDVTKADIIREMPNELVDMTWSCRHPKDDSPCGECHACLEVKKKKKTALQFV